MDIFGNIAGAFGALGLRRQLISFGYLGPMLGKLIVPLMIVVGLVAAIALAVKTLIAVIKIALAIAKAYFAVLIMQLKLCLDGVMALGGAFLSLMREALAASGRVMAWFGEQAVAAMEMAASAFRKMAEEGVRAFTELELSAAKVATVMGGIGDAALQARDIVMQFALEMSSRTQFAAKEVAAAMYEAYSAGFQGVRAVEALTEASLNLAAATQHETGPVMETLAAILNTFKLRAEDAAAVADILTVAIFRSAATMPKLIESMKFAGPVAAAMGINLKETVAILEGFYQAGLQGSMAGTYFRQSVVALTKETDNARKAFKGLGVDFRDLSITKTGSLMKSLEMLEALQRRVGKKAVMDALIQAFGSRGSFGIITLLNVGTAQLKKYQGQLNQTGLTAQAAADQLNTLSGAWKLLTNLWTNFETKLIKGTVANYLQWFVKILQDLIKYAESSGALAAMQNVLASIIYTLGWLVQQVGPTLIMVLRDIATQVPAVVYALGNGIAKVLPNLIGFLEWLPKLFQYAFANVIPMLVKFGAEFIPLFIKIAGIVLPLLIDVLTKVGGAITQFLTENKDDIGTWFKAFADTVVKVLEQLPKMVPLLTSLVDIFIQWAPRLLETAVNALPALLLAVQNLIPWLAYMATNVMPVLLNGIGGLVTLLSYAGTTVFPAFANNVVMFATWLMANWSLLMTTVTNGLSLWSNLLMTAGVTLQGLLPTIKNLLGYLNANWGTVWGKVGEAVEKVLNFLADLLDIAPVVIALMEGVGMVMLTVVAVASLAEAIILSIVDLIATRGKNIGAIWTMFGDIVKFYGWLHGASRAASDAARAMGPDVRNAARAAGDAAQTEEAGGVRPSGGAPGTPGTSPQAYLPPGEGTTLVQVYIGNEQLEAYQIAVVNETLRRRANVGSFGGAGLQEAVV
jgi:TP901 family phage tail tape measure protein